VPVEHARFQCVDRVPVAVEELVAGW
jgi:hypothetical protein